VDIPRLTTSCRVVCAATGSAAVRAVHVGSTSVQDGGGGGGGGKRRRRLRGMSRARNAASADATRQTPVHRGSLSLSRGTRTSVPANPIDVKKRFFNVFFIFFVTFLNVFFKFSKRFFIF